MKKVIDLSDVKLGDTLWSVIYGDVKVEYISDCSVIIEVSERDVVYDLEGRYDTEDTYPTLFHSFDEFAEYHGFNSKIKPKLDVFKTEVGNE